MTIGTGDIEPSQFSGGGAPARSAPLNQVTFNRRELNRILDLYGRKVAAGDVVKAAAGADKALIQSVTVFDVFDGGSLAAEGKKSLAIEVTIQPTVATLTDKEIEAISQKIVTDVKKATGGEIRG